MGTLYGYREKEKWDHGPKRTNRSKGNRLKSEALNIIIVKDVHSLPLHSNMFSLCYLFQLHPPPSRLPLDQPMLVFRWLSRSLCPSRTALREPPYGEHYCPFSYWFTQGPGTVLPSPYMITPVP